MRYQIEVGAPIAEPISRQRHTKCARVAFTLVELLLAVAVIGILSMMLLPALTSARRQARFALCENNLRQIGGEIHAYINYTDGIMPIGNSDDGAYHSPTKSTNLLFLNDSACRWNGPTALGILIYKGFIDDGELFYQSDNLTCSREELQKFSNGPSSHPGGAQSQYFYLHGGVNRGNDLPKLAPAQAVVMDWQGYGLTGGAKTGITYNHDGVVCHALRADGSVTTYVPESKDRLLDNVNCVGNPRGAFDFIDSALH